MSEAKNKVEWCLKKAEKEIESGSKHRGLIKTEPDLAGAKKHIFKAEHNFKAVIFFGKNGFSDWSVSAAFYTIYHCFLAIGKKYGYESRNQQCTVALIQSIKEDDKIKISENLINALKELNNEEHHESNAIELREAFQYGTDTAIEDIQLQNLIRLCNESLKISKNIVYGENRL